MSLTAKIVRYLNIKPSIAGLQVKRTYINSESLPLLMGVNAYVGSAFTLVMNIQS